MSKKLTLQSCMDFATTKGGKCLSDEYLNGKTPLIWQCKDSHIWKRPFIAIRFGSWCPECAKHGPSKKKSLQDCIDIANKNHGLCLNDEYIDIHTLMDWQCNAGHKWQASFNNVKRGSWCPGCNGTGQLSISDCIKMAQERNGKCLSVEYKNAHQKLLWECEKNHRWEATFNDIKYKKNWCPYCANHISMPQKEIYSYLLSTYPKLTIILNDTRTLKPTRYHLDIYIPKLKIGIEYDGVYFHYSDWAIKNGSLERMKRKDMICLKNGIKLLRINGEHRGNDWLNKKLVYQEITNFINSSMELI